METFVKAVALLQQLNTTPAPPAENNIEDFAARLSDYGERSMTVEQERDLVECFSFLAASTDDPRKVTAACVEEGGTRMCLTVRLAANSGDLGVVKEGLEAVAEVLMQVANASDGNFGPVDSNSLLLQRIVVMNRGRILSRLRSKHGKTCRNKVKPPIVSRLAAAIHEFPASKAEQSISADELAILKGHVKKLESIYGKIERLTSPAVSLDATKLLVDLVKSAYDISSQQSLNTLLDRLPAMQQSMKESLHKSISKLGRYYSVSNFLILAARRLPLFRQVKIETILPPTRRLPIDNPRISISALLDSLFPALPGDHKWTMETSAYNILKKRNADADAAISGRLSQNYRVHAEVQLLVYYALNGDPEVPQPRVICASKNACFLCNLFLKFDGHFYTRKTHGRLYEKWTLPDNSPVPKALAQRFGSVLGRIQDVLIEEIRKTLKVGRLVMNHPNESALAPSARWSSPSRSVIGSQGNVFARIVVGDAPRDGVVMDSSIETLVVTPFIQSDRFSKTSSQTSVENPIVSPPNGLCSSLPVRPSQSLGRVMFHPSKSAPLPPPLGNSSVLGLETTFQAAGDDRVAIGNATPLPGSLPPAMDARETMLPGAPDGFTQHNLPVRPVGAIGTAPGGRSRNTQSMPDVSPRPATPEVALGLIPTPPPRIPLHWPQLPGSCSPPTPLSTSNAVRVDTSAPPNHVAEGTTPVLNAPPLAIGQSPTSPTSRVMVLFLERGIAIRCELRRSDPELRVHTPHIHATITSDSLSSLHPPVGGDATTGQRCWVLIKYLLPNERPWMIQQGRNIVTVKHMERGEEQTTDHGAANRGSSLYLRNKGDLVEIKYDLENAKREMEI